MFTDKQISALKYLIFNSKDGNKAAKQVCAYLIDQSEKLTKEVCITFVKGKGYTEKEIRGIVSSFDSFNSVGCHIYLYAIMHAMGSEFQFSAHYGHYDETTGLFNTEGQLPRSVPGGHLPPIDAPLRYTFWLGVNLYSNNATRVTVTRDELDAVDISKPGLYPSLEKDRVSV